MENHWQRLALAGAVLTTAGGQPVSAQGFDYYLSAGAGVATLQDADAEFASLPGATVDFEFDPGTAWSAAIGAADGPYRSELELYHQKTDLDGVRGTGAGFDPSGAAGAGDVEVLLGLVNAYYDFRTGTFFRPFITAGLGYAKVDAGLAVEGFDAVSVSDEETGLAWQVGIGAGFDVAGNVSLDLRYRYLSGDEVEFNTAGVDLGGHSLTAGIRFYFP